MHVRQSPPDAPAGEATISEIARLTSLSRNTIKKWLKEPERTELKYARPRGSTKLDPYMDELRQGLATDVSDVDFDAGVGVAINHERAAATHLGAGDLLGFAAAPTFALMALLTCGLDGSSTDMPCSGKFGASPLSGMVLMYGLMSVFHLAPWLKWVVRRRHVIRRT